MKFDIAAKLVLPSQRAFVVHAGRARVNYDEFVQNDIVFLEAPYLQIESGSFKSKSNVRRAIRRSIALRHHAETTGSRQPSEILADYDDGTFQESDLQTLSGSVARLYGQAKKGDLVIVPGRDSYDGLYRPVIRFGEIASDFSASDIYDGNRPASQKVPFRKVRWLHVVPRKEISIRLEKRIGKPPAVREIKIDRDSDELLRHAYDSYIFEGNSSSVVNADKYDASDFVVLNKSSDLIAFLVSAHAVVSQSEGKPFSIADIEAFTERYFRDARIENIVVDFASPGYWRIFGASVSLAAFVALGIAVLSSGLPEHVLASGIEVVNSVSPEDGTAKDLEKSMNLLLKSVDKLQLRKAVHTANNAKKVIGLQSSTKPTN
ncbi:hypothetical protein [Mesorhizobium sp.]|uniref:hypothetical protein n=1 Tax=Mesorhizobium sp. TaxID=1871066 RepID=UPI000FEA91BF|nr:hypothetical protein [Mesorhizobium sp.]RWB66812.1 MAG: hypothetical protein EOQ49_27460 [Mesorhizobium sp.]RWB84123.1 MAG: hypothetical protein EOQ52_24535 [Mesorhizobium sp.]